MTKEHATNILNKYLSMLPESVHATFIKDMIDSIDENHQPLQCPPTWHLQPVNEADTVSAPYTKPRMLSNYEGIKVPRKDMLAVEERSL